MHALLWEIAVPVSVAGILGLVAWVRTTVRGLRREVAEMMHRAVRALALIEGEPADVVTGDPGRPPVAQQVAELRAIQDAHTVQLARMQTDVDAVLSEVRPNHGGSMRDVLDRIEARLSAGPVGSGGAR